MAILLQFTSNVLQDRSSVSLQVSKTLLTKITSSISSDNSGTNNKSIPEEKSETTTCMKIKQHSPEEIGQQNL
jgi:hypothetical protein